MGILDGFDVLSEELDQNLALKKVKESLLAKDLSCTFSAFGVVVENAVDTLTRLINNAIFSELQEHQSRSILSIDCLTLCKGDAYGFLSKLANANKNPIVIIENVTQIPDGNRTVYDDPHYVANLLLRSWKNDDIYAGDLHIDRRKFTVILTCPPQDADILQRECGLCSYSWLGDFETYLKETEQITKECKSYKF